LSIAIDPYLFVPFPGDALGPDLRIRFSEYDNASAPLDGIAIDDVQVTAEDDQRAVLELPVDLMEGTGPHTGHVLLAFAPTNTLTVSLSASPPDQLILPATVEVPAGQTDARFSFSVADDSLVNLTRTVVAIVTAPDVRTIPNYISILDDDTAGGNANASSSSNGGGVPGCQCEYTAGPCSRRANDSQPRCQSPGRNHFPIHRHHSGRGDSGCLRGTSCG